MENKEKINPEVNKVIDTLTKELESLNAEELARNYYASVDVFDGNWF